MISRVAESCFWLNRYVERVEVLARMLDVNQVFQLDVGPTSAERWHPLVVVVGQQEDFEKRTPAERRDDSETVQDYLVWEAENPASIASSLRSARENARTIRETISLEMWEVLNGLWLWLADRNTRRLWTRDRHAFYMHLRNTCLLFHGTAQATMLHEDPFEFMRLGTALERAGQTARVLDVKHHSVGAGGGDVETPEEAAQWLATLRFCSGVEPFFKRPENTLSGRAVTRFLLFDPVFPRSVLHNLLRAFNFLGLVRPPPPTDVGRSSQRLLGELMDEVRSWDPDSLADERLHVALTHVVGATAAVCEAVRGDFFDPAPQRHPEAAGESSA